MRHNTVRHARRGRHLVADSLRSQRIARKIGHAGYESREIFLSVAAVSSARRVLFSGLVPDASEPCRCVSPPSSGTGLLRHFRMSAGRVEASIRRALPIITGKPCFSAAVRSEPDGTPSSAALSSMVSSREIRRQAPCSPGFSGPASIAPTSSSSIRSPTPISCILWRR